MVATPGGLRRIEEIEVGDYVLAWSEETQEWAAAGFTDAQSRCLRLSSGKGIATSPVRYAAPTSESISRKP